MRYRYRSMIMALPLVLAAGLTLTGIDTVRADEPRAAAEPPIPEGVHLEPIDLARIWKAIRPALAEGRCPELIQQLVGVFTDPNPGRPAGGWYHTSQSRHDWIWLADHYDADHDGTISPAELNAANRRWAWKSLDRDGDEKVTPEDLDWSERSKWVKQDKLATARFQQIDSDANGRISLKEWQESFGSLSHGNDALSIEDLRTFLSRMPDQPRNRKFSFRYRWNRAKVILNGDIGSMFEGPDLNALAPDFLLTTQDNLNLMSLSQFRGQKPVVLIFGSFT